MVKLSKTRKGFTLVEMVLVIAIIVIISMVVWFSVSGFISKARVATSKIDSHNQVVESVTAEIPA